MVYPVRNTKSIKGNISNGVYLFIGEDGLSKDAQLKKLKKQFLAKGLEEFNLDILHAREIPLKALQERFLCLPSRGSKRLIVIRGIDKLAKDARAFILDYLKNPDPRIILVLDALRQERGDSFINSLIGFARVMRFKQEAVADTFALSRSISLGRPEPALRTLKELLKNGERPERILGGLRYAWERDTGSVAQMRRKLKLLLNCDMEIKTGRLKASFALEKLVICLCGLAAFKPSG